MALTTVLSVEVRHDRFRRYEELGRRLAEQAKQKDEAFRWTAHRPQFGAIGSIHFASEAPDFATIGARGGGDEMLVRVLGEAEADAFQQEVGECTLSQRLEISVDRPDLSYQPNGAERTSPLAVVTVAIARPGHQEACEELIRKMAEAIPKVGESGVIQTYQTLVGNLSQYWTVRPLESLADLDALIPVPELLTQAFGAGEGGLIYRAGLDSVERVERSVLAYREDLSNPG